MRHFFTLTVAALMTVGLSGCGGGIGEGIEPNVDLTKTYEPEIKAQMTTNKQPASSRKEVKTDVKSAAPGGG